MRRKVRDMRPPSNANSADDLSRLRALVLSDGVKPFHIRLQAHTTYRIVRELGTLDFALQVLK